jgi:hypothetical protein
LALATIPGNVAELRYRWHSLQIGPNVKNGKRAIEGSSGDAEAVPTAEK